MSEAPDVIQEAASADAPVIQSQGSERDYDAEARAAGWKPKEDFSGPEDKWVDAETFVKRGEEWAPYVRANTKKLEEALKATREELKATKKTMAEFREYSTKAEQRAYDRALKELQDRQDRAVEEGDAAAVRAVTQEIADLAVEVRDSSMKSQPQAENGMTPDYEEAVEAFKEANPWFETDEDMASWAVALDQKLAGQGMEDKARLKEIAKRARTVFPHKFENPARRQPSAVEGSTPPRRSSGRTYADLPADAKRTCDSFVKRIPGYTREDYLKNYQWD